MIVTILIVLLILTNLHRLRTAAEWLATRLEGGRR